MVDTKQVKSKCTRQTNSLLFTKERIAEAKRNNLKLVEMMLEESVSEKWLADACEKLCQDDYNDVVEERNILNLCGYPLCSKNVKIPRHKYHISLKVNKVYDITERKCFCSNECYKASKFLKLQLCTNPMLLKEDEPVTITLISTEANNGCQGEEIDIGRTRLSKDEIENNDSEIENNLTSDASSQLLKEIDELSYTIGDLEVKERHKAGETVEKKRKSRVKFDKSGESFPSSSTSHEQHSLNQEFSDDDSVVSTDTEENYNDDKKFYPNYENPVNLSNKYMPVISNPKSQHTVLITSLKGPVEPSSNVSISKPLVFIQNLLQEWVTEDTLKFLFGEDHIESLKKEILENTSVSNVLPVNVQKLQEDYAKLCIKLDKLDAEETALEELVMKESNNECSGEEKQVTEIKPVKNCDVPLDTKVSLFFGSEVLQAECDQPKVKPVARKQNKNRTKKKGEVKKCVRFSTATKDLPQNKLDGKSDFPEREIVLPFVDSLSQKAMRRQVITNKLKNTYLELLPWVGLHFRDICDFIRELIASFRLTAKNINFRPSESKIIALVLLRMLKGKLAENLCDDAKFSTLLEKAHIPLELSVADIDNFLIEKNLLGT